MLRHSVLLLILGSCSGKETPSEDADADGDADTDSDADSDSDTDSAESGSGPGPEDGTFETANQVTVTEQGLAIEAGLEVAGDRDFYVFDVTAGQVFQFYAQGGGETPPPDTVIRIYGGDQVLIAENDDLPYRMVGVDSGTYVQAPADGQLFVEVLEWSDWAGAGYTPEGGPEYDYTLFIIPYPDWIDLNEDENNDNDSVAQAFGNSSDLDGDGNPEYSWYASGWYDDSPYAEAPGTLNPAGDEDWLWSPQGDPANGTLFCQYSTWPMATAANLRLELWAEECSPACDGLGAERVASTDAPTIGLDYYFIDDVGITYPIDPGSMYYLGVTDIDGSGGTDHVYSAITVCYTQALAVLDAEDGQTNVAAGQPVAELVATGGGFARVVGHLDGAPIGGPDQADTFIIDWADAGEEVGVYVETTTQGSLLDDVQVTVLHEDSPGNFTEVDSATGPGVAEIVFPAADDGRIAVQIRSASGAQGPDQTYFLLFTAFTP